MGSNTPSASVVHIFFSQPFHLKPHDMQNASATLVHQLRAEVAVSAIAAECLDDALIDLSLNVKRRHVHYTHYRYMCVCVSARVCVCVCIDL